MNQRKPWMDMTVIVLAALLLGSVLQELWLRSQVEAIPYSQFQELVRADKVAQVAVSADQVQGELKEPLLHGKKRFVTVRVDADMAKELDGHKVLYAGRMESDLVPTIVAWVVFPLLMLGLWTWFSRRVARQMGGGLMSIGKSKAKVYVQTDTKTTFADVAGVEEAKAELRRIPGTVNVLDSLSESVPLTRVTLDVDRALRTGVTPARVGQTLRFLHGEDEITEFPSAQQTDADLAEQRGEP